MLHHRLFVPALALLATLAPAVAQDKRPTAEDLAKDNKLFITLATEALHWREPQEPFHIAGALNFVGTRGLGSYLFATSDGLILLNTGDPTSGPMVEASIRKLGFDPKNIKIIINGHGHSDHAGGFAYLKKLSGAQVDIMEPDIAMLEDGGKSDFHYGKDWQVMGQEPVKVDRALRDGDRVTLGEVTLTALSTPGHTRGSTTWVTHVTEAGKTYLVVFPDGGGFNPGYRLTGPDADYPGIADDYRRTHHIQEMLKPDMWFGHHTEYFDMEGKLKRMAQEGPAVWVDPEGYREFVAGKKRAFEDQIDREMGAKPQKQGDL
ncbi:subclass B3 metallo-beta-lactamase [Pleomorphomonas diazotrophica]|uniref:Subclass B3 metallo-beta-lactamase n=1 Tax=Pleomorphomonas diazotrophica TaxID=1166257 RepID=A0A1I4V992_9HYPH|nr:subclass B3 metallo-beta-lactamase [Pleomorphomonas diazotrophica]PKR87344.1 subclass B3 metallo-beta-lactamase [Pleomorphomonas diazotrophica]SFM97725.1 metallo-beta-lactamase class B [Pleomorphomonas diazotrophica]